MKLPLYPEDIIKILPHRYPFLFVDRITEIELGKYIIGVKNVTGNEYFFQGHFPDNPIMPGVLIVEAMAQVGGVLARLSVPETLNRDNGSPTLFLSLDKVKFRQQVVPGDQLELNLKALRTGSKVWKMGGEAFVDGKRVAEAILIATIN